MLKANGPEIVGHEIPNDAPEWIEPKPVRHFVLTLTRNTRKRVKEEGLPSRSLAFFKVERTAQPTPTARTVADVEKILRNQFGARVRQPEPYRSRKRASSLNFEIHEPTWLMVELDPSINWRFSTTHPAVTTKQVVPEGSNGHLRHVFHDAGQLRTSKDPGDDDCRFVFFRVIKRGKGEVQGFNFAIEIYQKAEGKVVYEIPIIVDPDVPETGQEGFP